MIAWICDDWSKWVNELNSCSTVFVPLTCCLVLCVFRLVFVFLGICSIVSLTVYPSDFLCVCVCSGGSRGQIQPWPPIDVGNGVWPPSGAERVMIALWICLKVRILYPRYRCRCMCV